MIRDQILAVLVTTPTGHSTKAILEQCEIGADAESLAAAEIFCHYMPEVTSDGGKWKLAQVGKTAKLLAAIENYAVSSGRKIFRLSSALAGIPANEHPTEDELKQALDLSHGKFQLLPNAMIKRTN